MTNNPNILVTVIVSLILILIGVNILYIKEACSTTQCFVVNTATIILLIWVITFWFFVLKHLKK
jgi:hypothetical protein